MENRDNQQERLLWWFGGIIDGEGCITINHNRLHRNTKKETLLFSPQVIITNTNKKLIDQCQDILQKEEIPFYVQYKERAKGRRVPCWWIRIQGLKRCLKALNIITQYLIAKKEEAILVKEFCEDRINAERTKLHYGNLGHSHYTEKNFEKILRIAEIHNRNPQRLYAEIRNYKLQNMI